MIVVTFVLLCTYTFVWLVNFVVYLSFKDACLLTVLMNVVTFVLLVLQMFAFMFVFIVAVRSFS